MKMAADVISRSPLGPRGRWPIPLLVAGGPRDRILRSRLGGCPSGSCRTQRRLSAAVTLRRSPSVIPQSNFEAEPAHPTGRLLVALLQRPVKEVAKIAAPTADQPALRQAPGPSSGISPARARDHYETYATRPGAPDASRDMLRAGCRRV